MKKILIFSLLCTFIGLTHGLSGKEIFEKIEKQHEVTYETETIQMELVSRSGKIERRTLKRLSQNINQEFKSLLFFKKPAAIRGVAMLTVEDNKANKNQWLYLPAQGNNLKRIASGNRKNSFVGTDFSYEDLLPSDISDYTHARKPDETHKGITYYVVDVMPESKKAKRQTAYKYRRYYIQQDNLFVKNILFYDKRSRKIKQQINYSPIKIGKTALRAEKIVMKNIKKKRETRMQIISASSKRNDISNQSFSKQNIISGKYYQ